MADSAHFTKQAAQDILRAVAQVEEWQRSVERSPDREVLSQVDAVDTLVVRQKDPRGIGRTLEVSLVRETQAGEWLFVPDTRIVYCWGNSVVGNYAELAQPSGDIVVPSTQIIPALFVAGKWRALQYFVFATPYTDENFAFDDCSPRTQ